MNNVWFTSDTHFGHKKILEYEPEARPFSSVEEMNEVMIDRWNHCVRRNDVIYHLGDFCFGKANLSIAERLNGKKRLIMGNHDSYPAGDYLRHFEKIMGVKYWKMCVMTHIPVHPENLGARAWINIHGHLHSRVVIAETPMCDNDGNWTYPKFIDENYFNVSVEQNNLYPFHADQILERMRHINHERTAD